MENASSAEAECNTSCLSAGRNTGSVSGDNPLPKAFSESLRGLSLSQKQLQRTLHLEVEAGRMQHSAMLNKHGIVHTESSLSSLKNEASQLGLSSYSNLDVHVELAMTRQLAESDRRLR